MTIVVRGERFATTVEFRQCYCCCRARWSEQLDYCGYCKPEWTDVLDLDETKAWRNKHRMD